MNSRAKAVIIIAVSLAVPFLALRNRWTEIRAFARQFQDNMSVAENGGMKNSKFTTPGRMDKGTKSSPNAPNDPQDVIGEALVANSDPAAAGRELLEALPHLPEREKVEAVHHLTNLLGDDDYAPLSQLLANPETPGAIQNLVMADLLNRPNGIKLPALAEVARTPNHAKAAEAREFLRPYLLDDFSNDWSKNAEKLNLWLKDHPGS